MKWLVFVVAVSSAVLGGCDASEDLKTAVEVECAPGSEWESNCHSCRCSDAGLALCTRQPDCSSNVEPIRCKPNTTVHRECNVCLCLETGLGLCTLKSCLRTTSSHGTEKDNRKKPENHDKNDVPEETIVSKSATSKQEKVVCVANRMFIKDCNTCWCNENGTSYFCTRKVCVQDLPDTESSDRSEQELRIIKEQCRPDEVFEMDCNMCRCNPNGLSFSCTKRACGESNEDKDSSIMGRKVRGAPQSTAVKEPPKACQPGQEFRMDCNKCLCDNEGQDFSCTRIDCAALNNNGNGPSRRKRRAVSETAQTLSVQCVAGAVFERECNVCRCTADGAHATCTMRRCGQPEPDTDNEIGPDADPNFRCNPGEQFKRDCNDCSCSADGKSVFCTLRLCDRDLTSSL